MYWAVSKTAASTCEWGQWAQPKEVSLALMWSTVCASSCAPRPAKQSITMCLSGSRFFIVSRTCSLAALTAMASIGTCRPLYSGVPRPAIWMWIGLSSSPFPKSHFHFARHQLHFVEIVVQGDAQVFLAPARVFHRNAFGDTVAERIRMADAFPFDDLHGVFFDEPSGGFRDDDVPFHPASRINLGAAAGILRGGFAAEKSGQDRPGRFLRRPKTAFDCRKLNGALWENCGAECTIADGQRQLNSAFSGSPSADPAFARRFSTGCAPPMAKRFTLWDNFRRG